MKALALDLKPLSELPNICFKLILTPKVNTLFIKFYTLLYHLYKVLPGFCTTTLLIYFIHCKDEQISKKTDC